MNPSLSFMLAACIFGAQVSSMVEAKRLNKKDRSLQTGAAVKSGGKCGNTFSVVPYGILGTGMDRGAFKAYAGPAPTQDTVFVDPAGLDFISDNIPQYAGGASGFVYKFLGLRSSFPEDVRTSITQELQAKYHLYPEAGVIHAVGPNLAQGYNTEQAIAALTTVYTNVLKEFALSGKNELRLLPISGGIFSGPYGAQIHEFTFAALGNAISALNRNEAAALQAADVKMCIFEGDQVARYKTEGDKLCGSR